MFQHTAARRRLDRTKHTNGTPNCFNTQPPEGGWCIFAYMNTIPKLFQHTAARRRLAACLFHKRGRIWFQHTAARRRLVSSCAHRHRRIQVSTHSRPKAAGPRGFVRVGFLNLVSTHSRPKAAGHTAGNFRKPDSRFNTQPPEGGWSLSQKPCSIRFRSPDFAKLSRKARTRV